MVSSHEQWLNVVGADAEALQWAAAELGTSVSRLVKEAVGAYAADIRAIMLDEAADAAAELAAMRAEWEAVCA